MFDVKRALSTCIQVLTIQFDNLEGGVPCGEGMADII